MVVLRPAILYTKAMSRARASLLPIPALPFAVAAVVAALLVPAADPAGAAGTAARRISAADRVTLKGLGPLRIGATAAQARRAVGGGLVPLGGGRPDPAECHYLRPAAGPAGVEAMIDEGRVARIDVTKRGVRTLRGARVGDAEKEVVALYGGELQVSPHKYVQGGHYLTLVPKDAPDRIYRLILETDGTKVTAFRVGRQPEVEYVERCS